MLQKTPRQFLYPIKIIGFLFIISGADDCDAQVLNPDSLMNKMEEFGNFLLYRNQDTTYIKNYSDKFVLKLIGVNKFNYFKIKDNRENTSVRYRPDRRLNLGIGFSYKWFALDLAFNVGITENSDFQNSKYFDFQGNIFSSRQFITATYQYYYGYQISKFNGVNTDQYPQSSNRDDIRTIFLNLEYTFALNFDKFSLKAPFIQNEIQRKSAGSFLLGASFNMFTLDADSAAIPSTVLSYFNTKLHLTGLNTTSAAINFGYMYTFVWKEYFYVTLSAIPGLGINSGDYKTDYRQPYKTHLYIGFKTLSSIGYNSYKIFGGIQISGDTFRTRIDKNLKIVNGLGKLKFFIGYRFG